ncbi:hypothetical protein DFJ58DRAFT_641099, partial [Suillus subalutaceus]|uniref:uncharacterized protein n=1 Tax=Suillus subalutaceus TaxID=48586 RepID=UPI001B885AAB
HTSIRKICFIGDDKQLPHYGQDDIHDLKSIFEVKHLKDHALFLNTQYRMPPQIGNFISQAVYYGLLESNMQHPSRTRGWLIILSTFPARNSNIELAGRTLDSAKPFPIATILQAKNKRFRIITPYDASRHDISK